jgi:hypothetical protein
LNANGIDIAETTLALNMLAKNKSFSFCEWHEYCSNGFGIDIAYTPPPNNSSV